MSVRFLIETGHAGHAAHAETICAAIAEAAHARGTGIARRTPAYIVDKLTEGKAIIAFALVEDPAENGPGAIRGTAMENLSGTMREVDAGNRRSATDAGQVFAGFCYIETWGGKKYVANSGLVVRPEYRHSGLAREIKRRAFELSRTRFPEAKLFGITTSHAVMKINTDLGYVPVPFSELTDDDEFWSGCRSCPNHDILERTRRRMCLCTGMLYDAGDARTRLRDALHHRSMTVPPPDSDAGNPRAPRVDHSSLTMEFEVYDV